MPYGYEPKDYLSDYSWLGRISDKLERIGPQISAVRRMNEMLKKNAMLKEDTSETIGKIIDTMGDDDIKDVAYKMGIDPNIRDPKELKNLVKSKRPTFDNETKSEDYLITAVQWTTPIIEILRERNSESDIMARVIASGNKGGAIMSGFYDTPQGKLALEQRREKTIGGIRGEQQIVTQKGLQEVGTASEQQQYDKKTERSISDSDVVGDIISYATSGGGDPMLAFSYSKQPATLEQKEAAFDVLFKSLSKSKQRDIIDTMDLESISVRINTARKNISDALSKAYTIGKSEDGKGKETTEYKKAIKNIGAMQDDLNVWERAYQRANKAGEVTSTDYQKIEYDVKNEIETEGKTAVSSVQDAYKQGDFKKVTPSLNPFTGFGLFGTADDKKRAEALLRIKIGDSIDITWEKDSEGQEFPRVYKNGKEITPGEIKSAQGLDGIPDKFIDAVSKAANKKGITITEKMILDQWSKYKNKDK